MVKLTLIVLLILALQVTSLNFGISIFDDLSCSTCEGVMNVVSKQIPNAAKLGGEDFGKNALNLAIKGACAYYTLGVPPALALCTAMTSKLADYLTEDISRRTLSIMPKSNCRSIGVCPPCKSDSKKLVMVQKKPNLPLPWDHHNKNQHKQMLAKFEADLVKKRKIHSQQVERKLAMAAAHQKFSTKTVTCYACKSILGMVGHNITDIRASGRNMLVNVVKQQCLSYVSGIPFSDNICEKMAQASIGKLADEIMGKNEIVPGPNCRAISMCDPCPAGGKCEDEEEVEKGKKAKETPLPNEDDTCNEPPLTTGLPCTDNYPADCKVGNTTCETSVYIRMMRRECMFTCVCTWLPKFSSLTAYLPGK